MRLPYFLNLSFILFLINSVFGQSIDNTAFNVTGKIIGRDTGIVVLYYTDPKIGINKDSVILKNGEFKFTGQVNRISDAYLWTDTSNLNFGDLSVVRFLLEPGNIYIIYKNRNAIIKGSESQEEKEHFEKENASLFIPKKQFENEIDSLYNLFKYKPDSLTRNHIEILYTKISPINARITPLHFAYIRNHPDSYFSAFLLSSYKRRLSLDTLQVYYSLLGIDAKSSTEGKKILEYIYPLTNDVEFRNENPLYGPGYNKKLNELESVYDISSKNASGKLVHFKDFKGQYLLIDFWASWCQPCIANFPFMKKLMEDYKSDPIQFIAVSLDTRGTDWRNAILKHHLTGIQLSDLKGFSGILPVYCKVVTSIPRYVLIDKKGKIINYDTPHPMNPRLKIMIDDLLGKVD